MNGIIAASRRLNSSDTIPPSIPTNLSVTATCQSTADLSWTASTDNVGIGGYKIYRDGVLFHTTIGEGLSYTATGLTADTLYSWSVSAYDTSDNESDQSVSVNERQPPILNFIEMSTVSRNNSNQACGDVLLPQNYTAGGLVANGTIIYTDICANSVFVGGNSWYGIQENSACRISNEGVISSLTLC